MKSKKLTHQQMNNQNWRYKKKLPPIDEFSHLNGPVKIIKPGIPDKAYQEKLGRFYRENM